MAKDKPKPSSSSSNGKARRAEDKPSTKAPPPKKHAAAITRGKTHDEILDQRKSLRDELRSLPAEQKSRVMAHLHGTRSDLSKSRLRNLKDDDRNPDASGMSEYQSRNLSKRRSKPDAALRRTVHRREAKRLRNAMDAADAREILDAHSPGFVEAENDMERTVQLTQAQLRSEHLDSGAARNVYDLELAECAPYGMRYDRSGRYALLASRGRRGHVSVVDQHTMAIKSEFYVNESVRDATFLHNGTMMAVSQERNVFVYDEDGVEVHRLDGHRRVSGMEFLPYHWLLATVGNTGVLQYQDTSTGNLVSQHRTKMGPCGAICQNPFNSVVGLGHANGTVTLWSPSSSEYLVKVLCHRGSPVTSMAVDRSGRYMATGGGDSKVKIFDLRTYKEVHGYGTYGGAPTCLDISQTGVLGVGHGCHTTFWRPEALKVKAKEPYMKHQLSGRGPLETLRFRPFEDACGIGHAGGVSSAVIPGSGEPNLDSMEHFTNPHMDAKQRREAEVRSLLEKLSPDMISLDPDAVGGVEESNLIQRQQRMKDAAEEANARKVAADEAAKGKREKKRMRGGSKISKKLRRKKKNIVDENVMKLKELKEREKEERERAREASAAGDGDDNDAPAALKRFF